MQSWVDLSKKIDWVWTWRGPARFNCKWILLVFSCRLWTISFVCNLTLKFESIICELLLRSRGLKLSWNLKRRMQKRVCWRLMSRSDLLRLRTLKCERICVSLFWTRFSLSSCFSSAFFFLSYTSFFFFWFSASSITTSSPNFIPAFLISLESKNTSLLPHFLNLKNSERKTFTFATSSSPKYEVFHLVSFSEYTAIHTSTSMNQHFQHDSFRDKW